MRLNAFKVIVVGGGPVGLTAANALHRAGIDFVLLERAAQIVNNAGTDLVLAPSGLRALSQLRLIDQINNASSELGRMQRMDHQGRDIGYSDIFVEMRASMGVSPRVICRVDLNRVLYTSLSDEIRSKILSNKKLSDISVTDDSVVATCTDGSTYEGSMVIGADGAHSMVRNIMRQLSLKQGSTEVNPETPFLTTYRCFWIRFPRPTELPVGTVCETHGSNLATQLFLDKETGVIGVYERLEQPTRERIRYKQEDQLAFLKQWGHISVLPKGQLNLADLYESKLDSGMVNLEEGVLDQWSWGGRIVLAGDAGHKYTPSTGAGCNAGITDVMALVDELYHVRNSSSQLVPTADQLASAFTAYQKRRRDAVVAECALSGNVTGTATWHTGIQKVLDRYVLSRPTLQKFIIGQAAKKFLSEPSPAFVAEKHGPAMLVKAA